MTYITVLIINCLKKVIMYRKIFILLKYVFMMVRR